MIPGCDSHALDPTTTKGSETLKEDTTNDIVEKVVVQLIAKNTSGRIVKNYGRRKLPVVPVDHTGPVPDVPVGTCWKYRWQVSEAGVHRPTVAGIHGRSAKCAFSIVLSGVYEDDEDHGDYFLYSGCGGKESDKKKRVSPQVYDQELTRHNRGLALCCYVRPVNDITGADAKQDWKSGAPVRVVRKHSKFSKYAPEEGFRYDGIYKVSKYYPVTNSKTGLKVWKFKLKRHDENPAPWTEEGKKRIEELNLKIKIPTPQECEDHRFIRSPEGTEISPRGNEISPPKNVIPSKKRAMMPPKELRRRKKRVCTTDRYNLRQSMRELNKDVKPNLKELAYASGANIPWTLPPSQQNFQFDVKPTSDELTAAKQKYKDFRITECEDSVIPECGDSAIDIDEDVKPDIRELNRMMGIERPGSPIALPVIQSSTSSATTINLMEDSNPTPENSAMVESQCPGSPIASPVIQSSTSCATTVNQMKDTSPIPENSAMIEIEHSGSPIASLVIQSSTSLATTNQTEDKISPKPKKSVGVSPLSTLLEISPRRSEPVWKIPEELLSLINKDVTNRNTWTYLQSICTSFRTLEEFKSRVRIMFLCPVCANVVKEPITMPCQHNICLSCLKEKQIPTCPYCSTLLPDGGEFSSNIDLTDILNFLSVLNA